MINNFDTDVAMVVGVNAAILYKNIQYWCEKNRTNGQHLYDGYYWTYNSIAAFCEQFPYLSEKQIRIALKTLEDEGYIKSGNYNKVAYDRTKWYADLHNILGPMQSDKREVSICPIGQMDLYQKANGNDPEGEPIPDINTNINTNIKQTNNILCANDKKGRKKRIPTIEDVREYCKSRNNNVDPDKFYDYYSSQGWKKNNGRPVEDWQACVRTWERNDYDAPKPPAVHQGASQKSYNPITEWKKENGLKDNMWL